MNIQGLLFDLDETLVDYTAGHSAAASRIHARYRLTGSPADFAARWIGLNEKFMGMYLRGEITITQQRRGWMQAALAPSGIELSECELDELAAAYLNLYVEACRPFCDVVPALNRLAGCPMGVVTNGDAVLQQRKMERAGLDTYFTAVVASGELGYAKPDPRIFLEACRRIAVPPQRCLYVGDNYEVDIVGARAAGLHAVLMRRRESAPLCPTGEMSVKNMHELLPLLSAPACASS